MAPPSLLLSDTLTDALIDAVEHGVPIGTAANAVDISPSTVYEWLQVADSGQWRNGQPPTDEQMVRILHFSERYRGARARWESRLVRQLDEDAEVVNEKTGQRDWRIKTWMLNNHPETRSTYRPQREVLTTMQGTVSHEHQVVSQLSQQGGYEAIKAARAELEALQDANPEHVPPSTVERHPLPPPSTD